MRIFFKFMFILLPWFISSFIFKTDYSFYNNINKPGFAPNPIVFAIVWPILYILISISIYRIYKRVSFSKNKDYTKALIVNYFSNQVFTFLFFIVKSPFIALVDTIIVLISSLFLYEESKKIDKTSAYLLIPYILWNIFATLLISSIYFMNLA